MGVSGRRCPCRSGSGFTFSCTHKKTPGTDSAACLVGTAHPLRDLATAQKVILMTYCRTRWLQFLIEALFFLVLFSPSNVMLLTPTAS